MPSPVADETNSAARKLIPGAYEPNTLTHRQAGGIGGAPFGSDDLPAGPSTMSAATTAEREKEGGGAISERRPRRTRAR